MTLWRDCDFGGGGSFSMRDTARLECHQLTNHWRKRDLVQEGIWAPHHRIHDRVRHFLCLPPEAVLLKTMQSLFIAKTDSQWASLTVSFRCHSPTAALSSPFLGLFLLHITYLRQVFTNSERVYWLSPLHSAEMHMLLWRLQHTLLTDFCLESTCYLVDAHQTTVWESRGWVKLSTPSRACNENDHH